MNRSFNIEVLEPLLLMSASAIDADVADLSVGSDGSDALVAIAPEGLIEGNDGDDILLGLSGNNVINGGAGNDMLVSVQGDNVLDGGSGTDTAVYWGNRADYTIEDQGLGIFAIRSGKNTDFVTGVEAVQFQDGTFSLASLVADGATESEVLAAPAAELAPETIVEIDPAFEEAVSAVPPTAPQAPTAESMSVDALMAFAESQAPEELVEAPPLPEPIPVDVIDPILIDDGGLVPPVEIERIDIPADAVATVSFASEGAGYQNTVGMYSVDPATGEISNVQILFGNASQQGSGGNLVAGDSVDLAAGAGEQVGFFVLADGNALNDIDAIAGSNLSLVAGDNGGLSLVAEQDGQNVALNGPLYVSDAALNPDGLDHFQIESTDSGFSIGIEDLPGLGDQDFDDVVLNLTFAGDQSENNEVVPVDIDPVIDFVPESPAVPEYIRSFDIQTPPGNDAGGDIQNVSTSFNETTNEFSFRMVIADADGDAETNGFTLAVNDGPNPKGNSDEMALFYFDNSGSEPVVSAYNYNGENNFSSYQGDGMISSAGENSPFTSIEVSVDANGNQVYSFTLDATSIVEYSDGADWTGVAFGDNLGMWLHPMTNLSTSYGDDGFLDSWDFDDHGWFDAKDQTTVTAVVDPVEPPAPVDPGPEPEPQDPTDNDDQEPPVVPEPHTPGGPECIYTYDIDNPPGHVGGGEIQNVATTFNETTNEFSFRMVITDAEGDSQTNGFTLAVNDGPVPTGRDNEMALFYFDNSGSEPVVSAYNYNGQEDASSYQGDPLVSSAGPNSPFTSIEVSIDADGNQVYSFTLDATSISEYSSDPAWTGASFTESLGMWLHPMTDIATSYNADGYLESWDFNFSGFFDTSDEVASKIIVDPAPVDPTPVDPAPVDPAPQPIQPIRPLPGNNQDPNAIEDFNATDHNTTVTGRVLCNDVDPDGDSLSALLSTNPQNGSVVVQPDGSYEYTPNDGFSGTDVFQYVVSDGNGGSDVAFVTIEVAGPPNQGPDAQDDAGLTMENTAVSGSVAGNDSDADGDTLTFWVDEGPANGSIEFAEDGSYTYTPDEGFTGQDTFTYEAADGNGGSSIATVTITVDPIPNQGPDAQDDASSTTENVAVSGSVAGNDSDADGDTLTFWVNEGPSNGSIEFAEDGSYTYTPDEGFSGQDTFTYEAADGNGGSSIASVTITVDPAPNQEPDAVQDFNTTDFNTTVTGHVLCNDVDPDGDGLSVEMNTSPANGVVSITLDGGYTYTPNDGFSGQDTFTYTISDGNGGTDTATVTITVCPAPEPPANVAPVANDDAFATDYETVVDGNVIPNDSDADGDGLTVTLVEGTTDGSVTLNADGSYSYTPNDGFTGQDTFTYSIDDGNGGTDTATVTIDVGPAPEPPANVAPVANDDAFATDYETEVDGDVIPNDSDADGNGLTATLLQGTTNGSVTLNADGSYSYTPNDGFTGQDTFTYSIDDGNGGTDTATVTIDVGPPANVAPIANDDAFATDYETVVDGNVIPNDSDADGNGLTATLLQGTTNGSVTLNADGGYSYTPNDGFTGQDTFTYSIDDGNGGTDTATVTIDVGPAPNTIAATDDAYSTDFESAVTDNVLTNDVDPDGDTLSVSEMTDVRTSEGGTVTLFADGSFVYNPASGFSGVDTFVYESSDGNGNVTTANVSITVSDAPEETPVNDGYTGEANGKIIGNVAINDNGITSDVEVQLLEGPANGTLTLNADGTFCYLPNDGYSGEDTFSYTLVNGVSISQAASVRLVLAEVQYDTTYVGGAQDGLIWGDPHFRGDDGGLFDVQGEADRVYNLLSDSDLQLNAKFIHWQGEVSDGTVIGELGLSLGTDQLQIGLDGASINGQDLQVGQTSIGNGSVSYDGTVATIDTGDYVLTLTRQDGLFSVRIRVIDPFSDLVSPHGLWGQTVDGDTTARNGDFYKENFDYGLQGGGAIDKVDADGNIVRTERGDQSSFTLYETADIFSTTALNSDGADFFRFGARQGTGMTQL